MRIRLRVRTDGHRKASALRGWLEKLGDKSQPAPSLPQPDKRWQAHGRIRYFHAGRLCVQRDGAWQTEYLFDILADARLQRTRVILPELPVSAWELRHAQRMTEALRFRLVRETFKALLDLDLRSPAIAVSSASIAAAAL